MLKYPLLKSQRGLTLLELLVVISIITILTAILFINFRAVGSKNLETSVREFMADLRWAQNAALTGKSYQGKTDLQGYGIYIKNDSKTYIIYYRKKGDQPAYTPNQFDVREGKLKDGVEFSSCGGGNCNNKSIFYVPPGPTCFSDNDPLSNSYEIVFRLTKPNGDTVDQSLKIYPDGLIQIE